MFRTVCVLVFAVIVVRLSGLHFASASGRPSGNLDHMCSAGDMGSRTVLNEAYKGLVEKAAIPADIRERDGKLCASSGSLEPIHCCTKEEVSLRSRTTHHVCDVFTDEVLPPLGELALVRLDDAHAEKVFVNRSRRLLLTSSDGRLAQWRSAPTFESSNRYIAGTPVASHKGQLLTVLTARHGNHYALSSLEGDGGYFDTPLPWKVVRAEEGQLVYGDRVFPDRDSLRAYVDALPPAQVNEAAPATPVLVVAPVPRVALVAAAGRQLAHYYLHGVRAEVQYL